MEIDVKKYFKIYRDVIKEIRKQNEQLHRYKQAIEEIQEIAENFCNACKEFEQNKCNEINLRYCNYNKIIQKCKVE